MPFRRAVLAGAAAAALVAAPPARADLVRLENGQTLEGKVSRSGKQVTVKGYKGKSATYAASDVKFVEAGKCSWEVAADMAREIPGDAADSLFVEKHMEVARYLKERRQYSPDIVELELKEYEAILRKAPDNEEAHAGLGHLKWAQWWFRNEKDRDGFRKGDSRSAASVMEPLGFVKYKKTGLWELKEDIEAMEAGKVRFKGRWMTEDEKKAAQGYVRDEKGAWVLARDIQTRRTTEEVGKELGETPVSVMASRHFILVSWLAVGETAQLMELFEKTFEAHRRILGVPVPAEEEGDDDLFPDPITVYILVDAARRDKWIDVRGKALGMTEVNMEYLKRGEEGGWHNLAPAPYLLSYGKKAETNRQRDTDHDIASARSKHTSQIGRIILDRIRGPGQPAWLMEGNAFLAEIRANETADCAYSSMTKYHEEVANKQGSKAKYFDFMKAQIANALDRTMRQIFTLPLNDLDWADSVKSWSFLEYLAFAYADAFHRFLKAPLPEVEEILPAQIEAAMIARRKKDPAAAPIGKPKDEGTVPTAPVRVSGAGAREITQGSVEERALAGARCEAWISLATGKDIETLEKEWKEWIQKK